MSRDARFRDKDKELRRRIEKNAPPIFKEKVNMTRVKREYIETWVQARVRSILGVEDFIVENLIMQHLAEQHPDPVTLQSQIEGFLEKEAGPFCASLWELLVSAQSNPSGLPTEIISPTRRDIRAHVEALGLDASKIRGRILAPTSNPSIPPSFAPSAPPPPPPPPPAPPKGLEEALERVRAVAAAGPPVAATKPERRKKRWGEERKDPDRT